MESKNIKELIDSLSKLPTSTSLEKLVNLINEVEESNEILSRFEIDTGSDIEKIQDIIICSLTFMGSEESKDKEKINFFKYLFNTIMDIEGITIADIKEGGMGSTSITHLLGTKVIKLISCVDVERKSTNEIPEHPLILKSLFESPIKEVAGTINIFSHVVVQEKLDTSNITEDDVYNVFKQLLDAGIVWADPKPGNLGRDSSGKIVVLDTEGCLYLKKDVIDSSGEFKTDENGKHIMPVLRWFKKMYDRYQSENENLNNYLEI